MTGIPIHALLDYANQETDVSQDEVDRALSQFVPMSPPDEPELLDLDKLLEAAERAVNYWTAKTSWAEYNLKKAQEVWARLANTAPIQRVQVERVPEPEPDGDDEAPLHESNPTVAQAEAAEAKPKKRSKFSAETQVKILTALASHSYATAETVSASAHVGVTSVRAVLRDALEKGYAEFWLRPSRRPTGHPGGPKKKVFRITQKGQEFLTAPDASEPGHPDNPRST